MRLLNDSNKKVIIVIGKGYKLCVIIVIGGALIVSFPIELSKNIRVFRDNFQLLKQYCKHRDKKMARSNAWCSYDIQVRISSKYSR